MLSGKLSYCLQCASRNWGTVRTKRHIIQCQATVAPISLWFTRSYDVVPVPTTSAEHVCCGWTLWLWHLPAAKCTFTVAGTQRCWAGCRADASCYMRTLQSALSSGYSCSSSMRDNIHPLSWLRQTTLDQVWVVPSWWLKSGASVPFKIWNLRMPAWPVEKKSLTCQVAVDSFYFAITPENGLSSFNTIISDWSTLITPAVACNFVRLPLSLSLCHGKWTQLLHSLSKPSW